MYTLPSVPTSLKEKHSDVSQMMTCITVSRTSEACISVMMLLTPSPTTSSLLLQFFLFPSSHLLHPHNSVHPFPFSLLLKLLVLICSPSTHILFSIHPHALPFLSLLPPFLPPPPHPVSLRPPLPSLHSSVLQLLTDSIVALLLRGADSLSVLAVGFKHTKSTPERNRYFATEISPFPGEYSLK